MTYHGDDNPIEAALEFYFENTRFTEAHAHFRMKSDEKRLHHFQKQERDFEPFTYYVDIIPIDESILPDYPRCTVRVYRHYVLVDPWTVEFADDTMDNPLEDCVGCERERLRLWKNIDKLGLLQGKWY